MRLSLLQETVGNKLSKISAEANVVLGFIPSVPLELSLTFESELVTILHGTRSFASFTRVRQRVCLDTAEIARKFMLPPPILFLIRDPCSNHTIGRTYKGKSVMPNERVVEPEQTKWRKKSASTRAGKFVRDQIRRGEHVSRSTKQAIAIGRFEARRAGVDLTPPKKGKNSELTRKGAKQA